MEDCPCGSTIAYDQCCEPVIKGVRDATTAEELIRARYCAYVKTEIDFIARTTKAGQNHDADMKTARKWSQRSTWHGLEILETDKGGPEESEGEVEFIAHYTEKDRRQKYHERAHFIKVDGKWLYDDGKFPPPAQVVRQSPKVGRNDPCPCGSGKKYKKCCAA